jgi:hypothetical protein
LQFRTAISKSNAKLKSVTYHDEAIFELMPQVQMAEKVAALLLRVTPSPRHRGADGADLTEKDINSDFQQCPQRKTKILKLCTGIVILKKVAV